MELHFLTTLDMWPSQDRMLSMVTPSIFTDGEGLRMKSWMLSWKDVVFLRELGAPTRRRVVFEGFIFNEFAVK